MARLILGTKAILGFMIGILLTIFGWYMIPVLSSLLPIASLKTIFWVGILLYWVLAVIVIPFVMVMGGNGDFKGAIIGLGTFLLAYFYSLLSYYIGGGILEALNAVFPSNVFVGLGWFVLYVTWVVSLIIVPSYLTIKDSIPEL
jgi:hypothetical protein